MNAVLMVMMIMASLQINIIWSENPNVECFYPDGTVNGCSFDAGNNVVVKLGGSMLTVYH